MKLKKLLILELETEEAVVATLLRALKSTDWEVTILGSELFLSKLSGIMDGDLINAVVLDSIEKMSSFNWHFFDVVLLPNPKFMPNEYAKAFLSAIGSVPFGIGVFDLENLKDSRSAINRCYDSSNSSLLSLCSFVYVSDLDFVNLNNVLIRHVTAMKKNAIVIPFKYSETIERSKLGAAINIVISGKVQAKRRNYLFAILSVIFATQKSDKQVYLCLNGEAIGFYGFFIFYLSRLVNRLFSKLKIISYKTRVIEKQYSENLRSGHINLLPLTSLYDNGKDSGAFYDSIQYNMINVCPDSHLKSIGSLQGAVSFGYRGFLDLIRLIKSIIPQLDCYLADSYSKAEIYKNQDFQNYLINKLNTLSMSQ
jgi:hypothetical protein